MGGKGQNKRCGVVGGKRRDKDVGRREGRRGFYRTLVRMWGRRRQRERDGQGGETALWNYAKKSKDSAQTKQQIFL